MFGPRLSTKTLSGFALKILYGDLLELTETKRRTYGDGIAELNRRLLALRGGDGTRTAKNIWRDPLPEDKKAHADELDVEVNKLGTTSKQTAAEELGRDWDGTEKPRLEQEQLAGNSIGSALLNAFTQGRGGAA